MNTEEILNSESVRNKLISNTKVLDEVKIIPFMNENLYITTEQAANYYDCCAESIRRLISRHYDEFISDGLIIAFRDDLKKYGLENIIKTNTFKVRLLTKKCLLRLGMLLKRSKVAKEVRNYLIAIEDNTSIENKNIVINKMENNIVKTDKLLTKTEVKKLINKEEYEKKKQNIEVEALLNRCLIYGLNKNKSAILIQESIVNNEDPEINVLKCLKNEKDNEQIKARNAIRERLAYLARTYYKSDYCTLYAVLSTRLKLSTGIDIRKIIDKQKKQYGKNSKKVQNHLDVIYENNLLEDAIKIVNDIYDELETKNKESNKNKIYNII